MEIKTQLTTAIERSISHTEIVDVTIMAESAVVLEIIQEMRDEAVDHAIVKKGWMDVWGFNEDAPEGDMVWRLSITFVE